MSERPIVFVTGAKRAKKFISVFNINAKTEFRVRDRESEGARAHERERAERA